MCVNQRAQILTIPVLKTVSIESFKQTEAAGYKSNLRWVPEGARKHVLLVTDHHPLVPAVQGQDVHVRGPLLLRHSPLLFAPLGE